MLIIIAGLTLLFNAKYFYQLMEDRTMNVTQPIKHSKNVDNKEINLNNTGCETCTPSFVYTLFTNISNKLGLSLAIYQK